MKGVHPVDEDKASENRLIARLRELTDATRRARRDLEELIKRPPRERSRGLVPYESTADDKPPKKK
jgi:hypothetical protein